MQLKEKASFGLKRNSVSNLFENRANIEKVTEHNIGQNVFLQTENDNKPAPSIEDTVFLKIMDEEVYQIGRAHV